MKVALIIGAWELLRPWVRRGLILAARAFWAYELRREMRIGKAVR